MRHLLVAGYTGGLLAQRLASLAVEDFAYIEAARLSIQHYNRPRPVLARTKVEIAPPSEPKP